MRKGSTKTLGSVIFVLGLLAGLALALAAIWGDFEAASYYFSGAGYDTFNGLKCPVLMSRSEVGTVYATLNNPSDQDIEPYYEVEIDAAATVRKLDGQVPLPAHTSRTVQWTVDANDITLGSFIMVKMLVLPVAGFATRQATCGVVVLNLQAPGGGAILGWALAASLLGIVLGLGMRETAQGPVSGRAISARNGMRATGIAALLAMLTGLLGWWLPGIIFVAVTALLLIIMLRFAG